MNTVTLAEALLRRKELNEKVKGLANFKQSDLYELKVKRQKVSDDIDDIVASVPKLTISQVTAEFDFYARQLRLCDAAIQQANWMTKVEVADTVFADYKAA